MAVPPAPEQRFFDDPATDRLMGVVFSLATELQVLRDRVAVLELQLEKTAGLQRTALDGFVPTQEQQAALTRDREAYVAHVLAPLLGQQASRS